ncbi:MAG: hypothetical protein ABMA15_19765 [Vicinamibacterales bacterium]
MRRLIAVVLISGIASPAFADIRGSVNKEGIFAGQQAARAAAAQARPNASGSDENPYFLPAVILMGAGGLVALYGLTHETGVECSGIGTVGVSCGTTKSKATIFTGVGMAGVGAFLFNKGRAKSSPQILAGPHVIGVGQRVVW